MKLRTAATLLVGAGIGAGALLTPHLWTTSCQAADTSPPPQASAQLDYDPAVSLAPLVDRVGPAVVNIQVAQEVDLTAFGMPHGFFPFGQGTEQGPKNRVQTGQGSGFIISADGYILTNAHVVDDADEVKIRLSDDREFKAKVVGTDDRSDVALVKIDADDRLPTVELGSSEALRVGDRVVAIGNPYGLDHTVTQGIVSAKGRDIGAGPYDDFIQTDASINPGNSGGPLLSLDGRVVGINTAVNRYAQGIAFATPIDMVTDVLDELKSEGKVSRGWIGVGLQDIDADTAKVLKVDADEGALVSTVYPGTPAAKAGLLAGDVLLKLDGTAVGDGDDLVREIGKRRPGDKITVDLLRDGKPKTLKITLGERPPEDDLQHGRFGGEPEQKEAPAPDDAPRVGITVQEGGAFGTGEGLVVSEVEDGSPADGRLRPGDVIVSVNHQDVSTAADLKKAIKKGEDGALFVVRRGGAQVLVVVPFE